MKYRLKLIDGNDTDFHKIKKEGFAGVIFSEKFSDGELIERARKSKLKTYFHIGNFERKSCFYISADGLRKGELYAVSQETVKLAAKRLQSNIDKLDGFVIPAPLLKELLWSEEGTDIFGTEDISDIFDKETELADIREIYYRRAAERVFCEYIMPVCKIEGLGKEVCVDLGCAKKSIELIKKQLNPFLFEKEKIPVIYEKDGEIICIKGRRKRGGILLVLPVRAIMTYYAWRAEYSRAEKPIILAMAEEEYYKEMFGKLGFEYSVIDEFELSEMKTAELKKFEDIIVCDACMLSEEERDRLEILKNTGVRVNDEKLLNLPDKEN